MLTPKLPSFIKLPGYKKFEYKPLYYDEAREEMKQRYEKIKSELKLSESEAGERPGDFLRERLKARWNRNSYSKSVSGSNIRLMIILIIIVAFLWYFFK